MKAMQSLKFAALLCAASIAGASPALAQQAIEADDGKPWVHPHSGIAIPAELGDFARGRGTAYAADFLDVGFGFDPRGSGDALTIYIYRKTNGDVPLWFAQGQSALVTRDVFRSAEPAFAPAAFTPPGQSNPSGLRVVYAVDRGNYKSTGLAVFEVEGWFVKVRATSQSLTPSELLVQMDEAIAALDLPQGDSPAAVPVADCETRLRFRGKSRDVASSDGAAALSSLLGGLLVSAIAEERAQGKAGDAGDAAEEPGPVTWCRDQRIADAQATYRANHSEDSYLLAFGDNGNAISVAPDTLASLLSDGEKKDKDQTYSLTLMTADRNLSLVSQDRMPRPSRAIELLENNRVVGSTRTWGDDRTIEINSGALK